jgi:drug/metabolite transporter (DMT)-like permease
MPAMGTVFCLASAAAFGAMGVFGKLAYEEGATVGTLLAVRFVVAAALLWGVLVATGGVRALRAMSRRDVGLAVGLGAIGYCAQAGAYFSALERLDASVLGLILYTFPVMVTVGAIALGRDEPSWRTAGALTLALGGVVLVMAGAASGSVDGLGTALALTAAAVYSVYILTSQGVSSRVHPLALSTLVCTGAAVTLTVAGVVGGDLHPGAVSGEGLVWLGAIAVISTVAAIGLFFAGLNRVGPTAAAILSTLEPVVTIVLASLAFSEQLGPAQLAGGALVLLAAIAVQVREPRLEAVPA